MLPVYGQRYKQVVFDSVVVTPDLVYGSSLDINNNNITLMLDVYEPYNDTPGIKRPLLVLAHGGSFVQGNRKTNDMVTICSNLAKRGFVVASIQYRLGVNIFSGNTLEKEFSHAVWRATQDGRAAIRWFRRNAVDTNTFSIDTNNIFTGGVSAGGVMGMHLAFLDTEQELAQTVIDTALLGGIEGSSGTAGYNWRVKGVVNLCGAISNVRWMQNNTNVSLCSVHGTNDQTVPYKTNYFYFLSAPVALLQGSFSIDSMAQTLGMYSDFYTFLGAGHVPFANNSFYMDTTLDFVAKSLYLQIYGQPATGIQAVLSEHNVNVYPNPVKDMLYIGSNHTEQIKNINLFDMNGNLLLNSNRTDFIDMSAYQNGMYFLHVETVTGKIISKKIIVCH